LAQVPAVRLPCDGFVVSDITVDPQPPSLGELGTRRSRIFEFVSRTVSGLHVTSKPGMIRRYLLLNVGEPCSELRRAESERILRAQPFLADASVLTEFDGSGGVRVHVITQDEFSVIVAGGARTSNPFVTRVKAGDGNLMGEGVYGNVEWRDGGFYRDTYAGKFTDYQLLGRPYQITIEGGRRQLGQDWASEARYPFFSDIQRAAWRVSGGESEGYFSFLRPGGEPAALSLERSYADIGGIIRIGRPTRLSLFGASLSREREIPGSDPVVVSDSGLFADTSTALMNRYTVHRTARINALWGVRNVTFLPVRGFDALTAAQDLRQGFQLGVLAGRSMSVLGSTDDDIFVAADLYAGWANPTTYIAFQVIGEGRQNYNENHWDGIIGSGRGAAYVKPWPSHTVVASFEYSAGWNQRTPFQLDFGATDGGVRGYRASKVGGTQRGVIRVEERWSWRSFGRAADVGFALFGDAGKMWAGDVPFGVDTPIRYGVGVSLLSAVPARSRRTFRVDVAMPIGSDPDAGFEVRFTTSDFTRIFWREPRDVQRSRERFVPASLFNWP
jgi:hypothetical protein